MGLAFAAGAYTGTNYNIPQEFAELRGKYGPGSSVEAAGPVDIPAPPVSPSATPETSASPSPEASPTAQASPTDVPKDLIKGSTDIYYRGLTANEVRKLERCGNETGRVLLTFDDTGPVEHVAKIQDYLVKNNIGAIFFPNNMHVSAERIREMREKGFWVGNHTYSHPKVADMDKEAIRAEIQNGVTSDLFRPPYGAWDQEDGRKVFDNQVAEVAVSMGKRVCMWNVGTEDHEAGSADEIAENVLKEAEPGSVILAHMFGKAHTLEALPKIKKGLESKGLEFCRLPDKPTTFDVPDKLPC